MKNSEALALIMKRLGNRNSPTLRATALEELNVKIQELELGPTLPWFLETRWEDVTVANQDYLPLPADFLREVEDGRFKIRNTTVNPSTWVRLTKVSLEKMEDETDNAAAQLPLGYALFGERVYFGPLPDQAYAIKLPYFAKSPAVVDNTADITNKWLLNFFNYLTFEVIDVLAREHIRDQGLVDRNDIPLRKAKDAFWRAIEARQHTNMEYLLTDSEN